MVGNPNRAGFLGHCMTPSSRNPRRAAPVSLERELEARSSVRMQLHVGKGVLAHRRRERPRLGRFARLCLTRRVLGVQVRQRRTRRDRGELTHELQPLAETLKDAHKIQTIEQARRGAAHRLMPHVLERRVQPAR